MDRGGGAGPRDRHPAGLQAHVHRAAARAALTGSLGGLDRHALARLAEFGLDQVGVADGTAYADLVPGCRSVVVVGSAGHLWPAFVSAVADTPDVGTGPHPLDRFVAHALDGIAPTPRGRWVRCAADAPERVDFRRLAVAAGLGGLSPLGLVVHPEVGPWLALRAAWFTPDAVARPQVGSAAPCAGCPAPCASAAVCPVGAVRADRPFDLGACVGHRAGGGCPDGCGARAACPVGDAHRPVDEALRYHAGDDRVRAAILAEARAAARRTR